MKKMRIVQIECFYNKFLDDFYQQHSTLKDQSFLQQIDALLDSGFSGGHNVVPYLNPQQWETHYLIPNCQYSQLKWWQERHSDTQPASMAAILQAQLQEISPDVLYLSDIPGFDFAILEQLAHRPFVIGWHATIVDERISWSKIDLVLSGIRHIRERACALGAKAAATYMPAAPWYRNLGYRNPAGALAADANDIVFSGSFSGSIHTERAVQYKQLSRQVGQHQLALYTPAHFPVETEDNIVVRPPVFGRDVLNLYAQAKIVLDSRGDFGLGDRDELETSNMRIFEATRAGALLITEYAHNLENYFTQDEIVTYRSTQELIEKVNFYLHPDNEAARLKIAAAGFARVNKEHLLEHRARWIEHIIETHYIQQQRSQLPENLSGHIYCTSAEADNVLFAAAEIQSLLEHFPENIVAVFCQDSYSYHTLHKQNMNIMLFKPDMLLPQHEAVVFGKANSEGRWLLPPAMLLALMQHYPDISRVTYLHPTVKILNAQLLKFSLDDPALYMLDCQFSAQYRYEQSVLGHGAMDLLSIPNNAANQDWLTRLLGRTENIALQYQPGMLDQLIANAAPVVPIKPASPWNFATQDINQLDGCLFLFSLIQRMQPYNYHLLSPSELDEQELSEWRQCYENIYLPFLNKLEDIWQKQLSTDVSREQTLSNVDDRQSTLFFNHNQISQLGYKRLTAQEYGEAITSIEGWNTAQAAATQHNAFRYLMQQYHAGERRADLLAIASILPKIKHANLSLLETGCGSGYNSEFIQEIIAEPYSYTGIDLAPAMVALGQQQYPTRTFAVMSSSELDFPDQQFDIVFNGASLMHTIAYDKAVSEAARVSKSFAIFHTVTITDGAENLYFRKNGYGSPVVEVCFAESKLAELFKQNNLQPLLMESSIDYNLAQVFGQATRSVSIACLQLPKADAALPHNYYYTYFDSNYLTCGMLMIESLTRHDPHAFIYVLCLDQHAENFLQSYAPNVLPIAITTLEQADPEFSACKHNRTKVEWYFTATSAMGHYLFQRFPDMPRLTYLDSDLFFYSSPEILHIESQGKSVQIIEHRFSPHLARLAEYGRFNVAWISFFNSEEGLRVLSDYRHDCIEWCYDRLEPHRFADQKYLDRWPERYPNCCVSRWLGGDVAHWNVAQWPISYFNNVPYVNAEQLIFYHFQGVKLQPNGQFATQTPELLGVYYQIFYEPYINEMNKMEQKLAPVLKDVKRQAIRLAQPPLE